MILVPIRTVNALNMREPWQARTRRVKREREATAWILRTVKRPDIPCSVLLTRFAPGELDDDGLTAALKGVRDQVADWLGVNDRDRMRVRYRYAQKRVPPVAKGGRWGVGIEFGPPVEGAQLEIASEAA